MLHTIHADFYRLFRSKGFWISEIILALNIISGVLLGGTGHVGVETWGKTSRSKLLFMDWCRITD